jgi:hypothetical protein
MMMLLVSSVCNAGVADGWWELETLKINSLNITLDVQKKGYLVGPAIQWRLSFQWLSKSKYYTGKQDVNQVVDECHGEWFDLVCNRYPVNIDGRNVGFSGGCYVEDGNKWSLTLSPIRDRGDFERLVSHLVRGNSLSLCDFTFKLSGSAEKIKSSKQFSKYLL